METNRRDLQDIFHLPRILGTFPFDRRFRLRKKLLAYSAVIRLVSALVSIYTYLQILHAKHDVGTMEIILHSIALISVLGDNFFVLFWWVKRQHTVTTLLENIDLMLRQNKVKQRRSRLHLTHYLLTLVLSINIFSFCYYSNDVHPLLNASSDFRNFLSSSSTISSIGQFWDLLNLLSFSFKESTRFYDENSVINYEIFSSLSESVNDIYQLQVLFTMTEYFIRIIFHFYLLLLPSDIEVDAPKARILFLTAIYIMTIASMIIACSNYKTQEKNFTEELRRRMVGQNSKMLVKNEKLNFHFIVGHETVFTACGFFEIDRSLMCSMISAATTYLVIVLQYGRDQRPNSLGTPLPVTQPENSTAF